MKISYMLKREDFYTINEKTLKRFFSNSTKSTTLYIYPHLNAIVRRCPSKAVKQYIYTEYAVNASLVKKLFVWGYTRLCLNTFGLFAAKKIKIPSDISSHTLIYPCNRKFRIFDFDNEIVSVITKSDFSQKSLHNEIEFRTNCKPCDFILPIEAFSDETYSERIIDGIPLARLDAGRENLERQALEMWREYSKDSRTSIPAPLFAKNLEQQIDSFSEKIKKEKPSVKTESLNRTVKYYLDILKSSEKDIETIQSHGDLQSGNIWIENKTQQIYIIDWESVQQRSIWYDEAVLHESIRKDHCFDAFAKINDIRHTTVVLEELIYRMNELCELPFDYGTDAFNLFINKLEK